jgi:hypothetical protein
MDEDKVAKDLAAAKEQNADLRAKLEAEYRRRQAEHDEKKAAEEEEKASHTEWPNMSHHKERQRRI